MPFRPLRDPLFLFCVASYFVNRLVLKPYFPNVISQGYWNDLICVPFWVPIMLEGMRRAGFREGDGPPGAAEIVLPVIVWSYVFEWLLPRTDLFRGVEVSDHLDILSYATGALVAAIFWRVRYRSPATPLTAP